MLLFCVLGTLPLEPALHVGVYRRVRRLALTLLPVVPLFVAWDLYAVSRGHWDFDRSQLLGLTLPGELPVEEVAFFVVVPLAAVLTLEAVRAVRGWPVGDEAHAGESPGAPAGKSVGEEPARESEAELVLGPVRPPMPADPPSLTDPPLPTGQPLPAGQPSPADRPSPADERSPWRRTR